MISVNQPAQGLAAQNVQRHRHRLTARYRVRLADHLRIEFIADAVANAITARRPDPGVVFQSDRGCQYVSAASPTWPGTASSPCPSGAPASAGTALAESFFARIEGELN